MLRECAARKQRVPVLASSWLLSGHSHTFVVCARELIPVCSAFSLVERWHILEINCHFLWINTSGPTSSLALLRVLAVLQHFPAVLTLSPGLLILSYEPGPLTWFVLGCGQLFVSLDISFNICPKTSLLRIHLLEIKSYLRSCVFFGICIYTTFFVLPLNTDFLEFEAKQLFLSLSFSSLLLF